MVVIGLNNVKRTRKCSKQQ